MATTTTNAAPASILSPAIAGNAPPPLAQVQAAKRQRVARKVQALQSTLIAEYNSVFGELWSPKEQYTDSMGAVQTLTAAQAWAALGTAGASLLQIAGIFAPAIQEIAPGAVPQAFPAGTTATTNADGTVTAGLVPPPAAPAPAAA